MQFRVINSLALEVLIGIIFKDINLPSVGFDQFTSFFLGVASTLLPRDISRKDFIRANLRCPLTELSFNCLTLQSLLTEVHIVYGVQQRRVESVPIISQNDDIVRVVVIVRSEHRVVLGVLSTGGTTSPTSQTRGHSTSRNSSTSNTGSSRGSSPTKRLPKRCSTGYRILKRLCNPRSYGTSELTCLFSGG